MLGLRRFAEVVFCVMSGMVVLPHVGHPQAFSGSVVGPSDAAVPGAAVTLTSKTTNLSRELVTDARGGHDCATASAAPRIGAR